MMCHREHVKWFNFASSDSVHVESRPRYTNVLGLLVFLMMSVMTNETVMPMRYYYHVLRIFT